MAFKEDWVTLHLEERLGYSSPLVKSIKGRLCKASCSCAGKQDISGLKPDGVSGSRCRRRPNHYTSRVKEFAFLIPYLFTCSLIIVV